MRRKILFRSSVEETRSNLTLLRYSRYLVTDTALLAEHAAKNNTISGIAARRAWHYRRSLWAQPQNDRLSGRYGDT